MALPLCQLVLAPTWFDFCSKQSPVGFTASMIPCLLLNLQFLKESVETTMAKKISHLPHRNHTLATAHPLRFRAQVGAHWDVTAAHSKAAIAVLQSCACTHPDSFGRCLSFHALPYSFFIRHLLVTYQGMLLEAGPCFSLQTTNDACACGLALATQRYKKQAQIPSCRVIQMTAAVKFPVCRADYPVTQLKRLEHNQNSFCLVQLCLSRPVLPCTETNCHTCRLILEAQ